MKFLSLCSALWSHEWYSMWVCCTGGSKGQVEHLTLSPAQGFSSTELGLLCFKAAKWAKFPISFQIKLNVLLMGPEILMKLQDFCFLYSDWFLVPSKCKKSPTHVKWFPAKIMGKKKSRNNHQDLMLLLPAGYRSQICSKPNLFHY